MSIKGFSVNGAVQRYDYTALDNLPQGQGVSDDLKAALLQLASKVAYIDDQGQTYYDDLYDALYPEKTLLSITANFQQGQAVVYNTDSLDSLKQYLTVTAAYDDGSTETVPSSAYTLSGTLTAGTSVITVTYEGKTDAFNVTVTAAPMSFTVTNNLTGCTTSNSATAVLENTSYTAVITASSGYTLVGATVSITMGGNDITTSAYSGGIITINNVTGALVISVAAVAVVLSSISAVYTQSGTVYDTDTLDSLKADLVVTANYSDSSTQTVPADDYTLSGTLTAGTSTITVSYGGKTTTFSVTVESGYQQVEYIEATTAGPVIDTFYAPEENAEIRCGMQQLVASNNAAMFGRTAPAILSFMWSTSEFYVNFARQSSTKVAGISYFNSIHDVILNKDEFKFDGVTKATFSGSLLDFSTDNHMMIFAWPDASTGLPTRATAGRCSFFQIYDSGTLVVDLIPVYRKRDGVIGMLDRVSGEFRTNVGTGTFAKGGDVA